MDEKRTQRLLELLFYRFEAEGTSLFAVLDAARDPRVGRLLNQHGVERECLLPGRLGPGLRATAPYVLRVVPGSNAWQALVEDGWGQSWGLYVAARSGIHEVVRHLRGLLRVQTEDGEGLIFRYYDPRVMRFFLPTCEPKQLRQVFGPIQRFDMEDQDSSHLLRFRIIPTPGSPINLRSWRYSLCDTQHEADDRGTWPRVAVTG